MDFYGTSDKKKKSPLSYIKDNWVWLAPTMSLLTIVLQLMLHIFNGTIQEFGLACVLLMFSPLGIILCALFLGLVILFVKAYHESIKWYWGASAVFTLPLFIFLANFVDLNALW